MGLFTKPVNLEWRWAAFGKHPAARDYFHIGADSPILKAFSNWIDSGFDQLIDAGDPGTNFHSWRFWANGPEKDQLICGICKQSSDQIGRPYPFVIMGTGHLRKWRKYWGLVPVACDRTWIQMEYRASRRYGQLTELEGDIRNIQAPHSDWQVYSNQRGDPRKSQLFGPDAKPYPQPNLAAKRMAGKSRFIAQLPENSGVVPLVQANTWHYFLQAYTKTIPNAVFIGGYQDRSYLAVFNRSLAPEDFKTLWSTGVKGTDLHGKHN